MIRRHLPVTIALTAILSLVAGGVSYAAWLAPGDSTVKACVSTSGYVRTASNGNKCPGKSKAVLLDKSGSSSSAGDEVVVSADLDDESLPAGVVATSSGDRVDQEVAEVPFTISSAGFYEVVSGVEFVEIQRGECDGNSLGSFFTGPEVRQGDAFVDSFGSIRDGSLVLWLTPDSYRIRIALESEICPPTASYSPGSVEMRNMRVRVLHHVN